MAINGNVCSWVSEEGKGCTIVFTRQFNELAGAWRCRHHARMDDGTNLWPAPPKEPEPEPTPTDPPPIKKLKGLKDVEKMTNWATMQMALGQMDESRGKAIIMGCREWRSAHGDRVLKTQQDKLRRDIKKIKRGKSERHGAKNDE